MSAERTTGKPVRETGRRKVPRPQPAHEDRRTKRRRTRAERERQAKRDQE